MPRTSEPRPLPPTPDPQKRCVYELQPSTGWRWHTGTRSWERVCDRHAGSVTTYVPDTQITDRQDP